MSLALVTIAALFAHASSVHTPESQSKSIHLRSSGTHTAGTGVSPKIPKAPNLSKYLLEAALAANSSSGEASLRPPSCIQNTGVSCLSEKCAESNSECKFGQCSCKAGCASTQGGCHPQQNLLVATGFRLRNAKWPRYYMVASTLDSQLSVASSAMDPLAQFSLYQLPGQGKHPKGFLLVPQASPGFAASIVHTYKCDELTQQESDAVNPQAKHQLPTKSDAHNTTSSKGKACQHFWNTETQPMSPTWKSHPSVLDAAVHLAKAPISEKNGMAITIRGAGDHVNNFMFIHAGSWKVENRADDPELGGYWIPEPPLPVELSDFDGPPCLHACESLSAPSSMVGVGFLLALLAAMSSN